MPTNQTGSRAGARLPAARSGAGRPVAADFVGHTDAQLIEAAREPGGIDAFAVLWERYHRAGLTAARSVAPDLDPEDIVAEAYARILDLTRRGRGPSGEFRPYLYRVIQSIAGSWRRRPESTDEALDLIAAPEDGAPWSELAAEREAVTQAFAELPPRWREVLWRTEVEGLPPRAAADALGLSPNGVSALARRAKGGLREAWARLHHETCEGTATKECHPIRALLPAHHAGRLTDSRARRLEAHLAECTLCRTAARALAERSRLAPPAGPRVAGVRVAGASGQDGTRTGGVGTPRLGALGISVLLLLAATGLWQAGILQAEVGLAELGLAELGLAELGQPGITSSDASETQLAGIAGLAGLASSLVATVAKCVLLLTGAAVTHAVPLPGEPLLPLSAIELAPIVTGCAWPHL